MTVRLPIKITNTSLVTAIAGGGGSGGNAGGGGSGSNAGVPIMSISTEKCKWQKDLNQLTATWELTFPKEVVVFNPKTSEHRVYLRLDDTDPRFDQDQWDGEQMVYKTKGPTNKAEYLVLYHS
jgi:hypothetical protein